jgi:hypothetical protein
LAVVAAVGAVLAVAAIALAEKPVTVTAGQEVLMLDGGFSPKALSKSIPTPVALRVSGRVESAGGVPPPALRELVIETDKSGAIDLAGLPVCVLSGRDIREDAGYIRRKCKSAIIGTGKAEFELAFPEVAPLLVDGRLTIFNSVVEPHAATLLALVDLTGPYSVPVIAEIKVTTIHAGRFGMKAVVSIPTVAGGRGALVSFNTRIFKKLTHKGKTKSVLTLTCADGKVLARAHGVFEDGTESDAQFVRTCTPRTTIE